MMEKKKKGLLATFEKLARHLHIGKGVFEYSLTSLLKVPVQPDEAFSPAGYSVVPGTIENLDGMARCRKMEDEEEGKKLFTSRFLKNSLCYLLLDPNKDIVGYAWVTTAMNLYEDNDRYSLFCSPIQAYIFDTFLKSEVRGKQLYGFLIGRIQQFLSAKGRTDFFVLVDNANTISLRAHGKLGAKELETYRYCCLFGLTFHSLQGQQKTRRRLGLLQGHGIIESFAMAAPDLHTFSISVQALDSEEAWELPQASVSQLEETIGDSLSPFHLFSVAHNWWKTAVQDQCRLFLLGIYKGHDRKLVGYGIFRLYANKERFGHPKELIAFDDLYFMENCFFIHVPDLLPYTIQKLLSKRNFRKEIRKVTDADILSWHRIPPRDLVPQLPKAISRWAVKVEAEYPILEINDNQSFRDSGIVTHVMHDITKQQKRMVKAFGIIPELCPFELGLLDELSYADREEQFLQLMRKTWQYEWMKESPLVDTDVYESRLRNYSRIWSASNFPVLYFLDLGEKHIAFLYALRSKTRCWCLLIGYDPDFKTYSPGKTIFLGMLHDMSNRGVTQFHLGGNVVGWKEDWQSYCAQIYRVEYYLNAFFVLPKVLKALLKRG
ncbi:GNAT family N-acetyltransferase [uncultured Sphaerochaeta sp.]|uniref:GNAT family N-acetyltransferase n=1 Tax=uncultured Sphaerochaeta sp. TaxID=886478 RepID=UPI002A0A9128|nr:GNAT family N-acetyltransferase [uncultured Sphaerochaeta sp.]